MPGALVYTDDDLDIVVCNDRFKEMYIVPAGAAAARAPYPDFLRYLAENGYYGEGDSMRWSRKRVESLRNPTGKSFEDHTPDGRWFRILPPPRGRRRHGHGDDGHHRAEAGRARSSRCDAANRGSQQAHHREEPDARSPLREIQDKNRQVEEQAAQIAEWNARLETRVTEQVAQIGQMSKLTRFLSPKSAT